LHLIHHTLLVGVTLTAKPGGTSPPLTRLAQFYISSAACFALRLD